MADFAVKGTEYDTLLTSKDVPCTVKIGGMTEKFVPNINASKWDDECWLNINHPDVVVAEKESVVDGKISLTVGERTHRYYVDEKGRLEYEIELAQRPKSNEIYLNLAFPDGLEFFQQPKLTPEKIATYRHRPEDVEGSYAVYWCKGNNKYKTGKFCHIYRPRVTDSKSAWTWGTLDITGSVLTIMVDGKWLDKAMYPVVVDPTLGYDTVGASNLGHSSYTLGNFYTADADGGAMTLFHIAIESIDGTSNDVKIGVYATNGSGNPSGQALIEYVTGTASVTTDLQINPTTGETLAANTQYWIGFTVAGNGTDAYYDTAAWGSARHNTATVYADMFTNPAGTYTEDVERFSIWIDYGGAPPAGLSIPVAQAYYRRFRN